MDAQTVLDNINKYRYGVLIGNCTEERFGEDMAQRQVPKYKIFHQFSSIFSQFLYNLSSFSKKNETLPMSTMKDNFGLQNSVINQ